MDLIDTYVVENITRADGEVTLLLRFSSRNISYCCGVHWCTQIFPPQLKNCLQTNFQPEVVKEGNSESNL